MQLKVVADELQQAILLQLPVLKEVILVQVDPGNIVYFCWLLFSKVCMQLGTLTTLNAVLKLFKC